MRSAVDFIIRVLRKATWFLQPSFTHYGAQYGPRKSPDLDREVVISLPDPPPSISIVIPSLNQGAYLQACIESLLRQNYPELEIVVVDGGSNDGSLEIVRKYSKRLSWWRSGPDKGQADALNRGFAKTSGRIMGWLNADDLHMPGTLARVANFFVEHPEIDAVYGNRILIDSDGAEIGRWILPPHENKILSRTDVIPQETLFWRRKLWNKIGGRIDQKFSFAMDWDLIVKFRDAGAKMKRIPCFLGCFRIHEKQKSSPARNRIGDEEMQRIRKDLLGFAPSRVSLIILTLRFFIWARVYELIWKVKESKRKS